jgi:ankyrin repeat protein
MNSATSHPFSAYACQQLLYHSEMAARSIPQCEFLDDPNEFQLSRWIEVNNLFEMFKFRKYGPDASLIYILADTGHPNLIRQWSSRDPHIHFECPKERYRYPFFASISSGDKDAVAALLNIPSSIHNGVDIMEDFNSEKSLKRYKGQTPLTWAAMEGRTSIIQLLLLQGLDPNEINDRMESPLLCASSHDHESSAKLLLESGANISELLLGTACEKGFHRLVILIIENGGKVDRRAGALQETSLFCASRSGHIEIVRLLIQRGATVNARNSVGATPLFDASLNGHKEVVQLLIDNGAGLNAVKHRSSPLFAASRNGHEATVQLLIGKGADINAQNFKNDTPLLAASRGGHEAVVRFLIEKGADINMQNYHRDSSLFAASRRGHEATVQLLI